MDQFLVNGVIPVIRLRSSSEDSNRGNLVIIYGGTKDENYRFRTSAFGGKLACLGFNVFCFDFRSNLDASRFEEFGLYDRLNDSREVVLWVRDNQGGPLSLLGVSMGGSLAVNIAAELGKKVKNLFLVAPAAYHREAMKPEVKFGPQFSEIIREPRSWHNSNSFEEAKKISANTLIIQFRDDQIVPKQIPMDYWRNVGAKSQDQNIRLTVLDGGHKGKNGTSSIINPERQDDIVRAIQEFLALPPLVRN